MADIQPALSHDHPLYYDAASTVREDSDKLLAKLRRAHALSERYCNLGAKMAAVSSELASELVGAASLCESEGLRSALGVLASEAEVEATLPPKQQLAVIANALTRTAQASEMLAAQLRAIVSEPLRELIEDPEGPAAIAAKHAELTAASHAMHESLLDTLRPGVGAGSRPRASDLSKGAASATFAAKGAARGMGGMFSKLMERAGQGNVSMLASVASQIDESLGITGAEPSSGAAGNASRQGLPAPAPEVLPRRQASRAGGASATADEDAPPPTAEERLVEGQLAFAAARLEFELRAREAAHRARDSIVAQARGLFFAHLTFVHQAAAALDGAEGEVLQMASETGTQDERAAVRLAAAREARASLAELATLARAPRSPASAERAVVRLPRPLLPFEPRGAALPWACRPASDNGAEGAGGAPTLVPSLRALAVSLRGASAPAAMGASSRAECVCGYMFRIVDTPLGKSWKRVWVELIDGRLHIYRISSKPDAVTYVTAPVTVAGRQPSAAEPTPAGPGAASAASTSAAAAGCASGGDGGAQAAAVLARSPYAEETLDLLTSSARTCRDASLVHSVEIRLPQSLLVLQPPTAPEQAAWLQALQSGVHTRLEQQLKAAHSTTAAQPAGAGAGAPAGAAGGPADLRVANAVEADAATLATLLGHSCDDCGAPNAQWVSINLAVLLCPDCAGCHRSLGTHVSKVRSLTLDRLEGGTLRMLARARMAPAPGAPRASLPPPPPPPAAALVGAVASSSLGAVAGAGQRAFSLGPNTVYEARVPLSVVRPVAASVREQKEVWIRLKYEVREFLPKEPPPVGAAGPQAEAEANAARLAAAVRADDLLAVLWALLLLRGGPPDAIADALAMAEAAGQAEVAELLRQHLVKSRPPPVPAPALPLAAPALTDAVSAPEPASPAADEAACAGDAPSGPPAAQPLLALPRPPDVPLLDDVASPPQSAAQPAPSALGVADLAQQAPAPVPLDAPLAQLEPQAALAAPMATMPAAPSEGPPGAAAAGAEAIAALLGPQAAAVLALSPNPQNDDNAVVWPTPAPDAA